MCPITSICQRLKYTGSGGLLIAIFPAPCLQLEQSSGRCYPQKSRQTPLGGGDRFPSPRTHVSAGRLPRHGGGACRGLALGVGVHRERLRADAHGRPRRLDGRALFVRRVGGAGVVEVGLPQLQD